jgi:hypothetical protein
MSIYAVHCTQCGVIASGPYRDSMLNLADDHLWVCDGEITTIIHRVTRAIRH